MALLRRRRGFLTTAQWEKLFCSTRIADITRENVREVQSIFLIKSNTSDEVGQESARSGRTVQKNVAVSAHPRCSRVDKWSLRVRAVLKGWFILGGLKFEGWARGVKKAFNPRQIHAAIPKWAASAVAADPLLRKWGEETGPPPPFLEEPVDRPIN